MKVSEVIKILELWAPREIAWERDNSGLQSGNRNEEIKNILLSLDLTDDVITEAINNQCNLIITHHPLLFSPLRSIDVTNNKIAALVTRIIKNDITLYSAHTNLDFTKEGVSYKLAEQLQLRNIDFLRTQDLEGKYGFGAIGELPEKLDTEGFLKYIADKLNIKSFRYNRNGTKEIKLVAVCGGAGSELLYEAIARGCDAFITGDIKYHTFHDAEEKILLVDAGHFETEIYSLDEIEARLKKVIPAGVNIYQFTGTTNPIIFYNT